MLWIWDKETVTIQERGLIHIHVIASMDDGPKFIKRPSEKCKIHSKPY